MTRRDEFVRELSRPEEAFTRSNEVYPLCVCVVLKLIHGPSINAIYQALAGLQARHVLLRARIVRQKKKFGFMLMEPVRPISLTIETRKDDHSWQPVTNQLLNTYFDISGPLIKCSYLPGVANGKCELIVVFHHAIIDGNAARLLLHELLALIGGETLEPVPEPASIPAIFPVRNFKLTLFRFLGRQLLAELNYAMRGDTSPIPRDSENGIISLQLTENLSRRLSYRVGREGLSLNSVLNAAMLLAVLKHRHPNRRGGLVRAIAFADLRFLADPAPGPWDLGCYIALLRFSLRMVHNPDIWQVAKELRREVFTASRRQEVPLMGHLSNSLIRMALATRTTRLGTSALSFLGKLDLEKQYGAIQLVDVLAYITNNRLGPEFSGFGKILFGRIELDFTYLTAETDEKTATAIVAEIRSLLEMMAEMA